MSRQDLVDLDEAYIATCNRHAVSELGEFVHPRLSVNGRPRTLSEYAADVGAVFEAFPDYAWTVEHLVVEEPWISVRLSDRGTHRGPWLGQPPPGGRWSPTSSRCTASRTAGSPRSGALPTTLACWRSGPTSCTRPSGW
jgi:predicted ester cyclase